MWLHRIPLSSLCHSAGTSMAACARTLPKRHVVRTQRTYATQRTPLEYQRAKDFDTACYVVGAVIISGGISFASVPLYRAFCQATGLGGAATQSPEELKHVEQMAKVGNRLIRVLFTADVNVSMQWRFRPQQSELWVHPGETALAFYTATNPTSRPIIGISTYNVVPFEAGLYFGKIQCFCFEEQVLNPGETVDMPVFFYIDPDYVDDTRLEFIDEIMLSYTFYEAKKGLQLPQPLAQPSLQ